MTLAQLTDLVETLLTRAGNNRISGQDIKTVILQVIEYFTTQVSSIIPDWTEDATFNIDGTANGQFVKHPDINGKIRLWQTKVNGNHGNTPPTDPSVTENANWIEISASSGSAISEWRPGIFGAGLMINFHNHSKYGRGLYLLLAPSRPFNSVNIENEIEAGLWVLLDSKQKFLDILNFDNDAGGMQIRNLKDPTRPQDADTMAARDRAISDALGNLQIDNVSLANVEFKNTSDVLKVLWQDLPGSVLFEQAGMSGGTLETRNIFAAAYDPSGLIIWMLARNGLYKVDFTTYESTLFSFSSGNYTGDPLPSTPAKCVFLGNVLYILNNTNGFYAFDTVSNHCIKYDTTSSNYAGAIIPANTFLINATSNTDNYKLILVSSNSGLFIFDPLNLSMEIFSAMTDNYSGVKLPAVGINTLASAGNEIWLATTTGSLKLYCLNIDTRHCEGFSDVVGNYGGDVLPNAPMNIVSDIINDTLYIANASTAQSSFVIQFNIVSRWVIVMRNDTPNYNGDRLPTSGTFQGKLSEDRTTVYFSTGAINGSNRGAIYMYDIASNTFTLKQYFVGIEVDNDLSFIGLTVMLTGNGVILPTEDLLIGTGSSAGVGIIYTSRIPSTFHMSFSEDGLLFVDEPVDYITKRHAATVRYVDQSLSKKLDATYRDSTQPWGVELSFDVPRVFKGATGFIELTSTELAVVGMKAIVIHNDVFDPIANPSFKRLSGTYMPDTDNYFEFTYLDSDNILYTVNQIQT